MHGTATPPSFAVAKWVSGQSSTKSKACPGWPECCEAPLRSIPLWVSSEGFLCYRPSHKHALPRPADQADADDAANTQTMMASCIIINLMIKVVAMDEAVRECFAKARKTESKECIGAIALCIWLSVPLVHSTWSRAQSKRKSEKRNVAVGFTSSRLSQVRLFGIDLACQLLSIVLVLLKCFTVIHNWSVNLRGSPEQKDKRQ
eukprot:6459021-Amphidinium_carterae.1